MRSSTVQKELANLNLKGAIGGGCTTVTSNDLNFRDLPGGNPPYYRNLRYAEITSGRVIVDQFFG